jgi:clathrin heavy chain
LLKFFVENGQKEFFTVTLYTCYELLKPDIVLEYAWRFGLYDFTMPYIIQLVKELNSTVGNVQQKIETR